MPHVGRGPWLAHDTITLRLWGQRAPHGVFATEAHVEPHRGEEEVEDRPQDHAGVEPPQELAHRHPEAINTGETPGPNEPQDQQEASQDEAPQAEGVAMPYRWPDANQHENTPDNKPE